MTAQIESYQDVTVVTLPDRQLDARAAKGFKQSMAPVFERHTKVVFDMNRVEFVDSAGLAVILSCLRQLNNLGGDLRLCAVAKPVRALLEMVRMHRIVEVMNTREEAVAAFRHAAS